MQPYPYLLICARDRKPNFPAWHCIMNPVSAGFGLVDVEYRKKCGNRRMFGWFLNTVVIDPEGLNPATFPKKFANFVERMFTPRQWANGFYHPFVFLCDPFNDLAAATIEMLKRRHPPKVDFYLPEMGIRGFKAIFRRFPQMSVDDATSEIREVSHSLRQYIKNGEWALAHEESRYLNELLDFIEYPGAAI